MNVTTKSQGMTEIKNGSIISPHGFHAGGLHCGIRKTKLDLAWLYTEKEAVAAAVYTTNSFKAAPLNVTKESIESNQTLSALICNSGVANACTGKQGEVDALEMRHLTAAKLGLAEKDVAVASTGLIGTLLPMDKIRSGIDEIDFNKPSAASFESAILTTDTVRKGVAVTLEIDGKTVTIGGAAKGSGMINPNMATMLSFITTDAHIEKGALTNALKSITNQSYNMITVDGDTSTNDMVCVMANGLAGNDQLDENHPEWHQFYEALFFVSQSLAKSIARDGEGATKLIEVQVEGAHTEEEAQQIAKSIIGSNLVKTAIHGSDANWGRIITAIGYSGIEIDPNAVDVALGDIDVVKQGVPVDFDEIEAKRYLEQDEIVIYASVGKGTASSKGWGCDLSYDYVQINASYRT
ncbi:glutamate N-acetyltransferase [Pelagirhabdus alkalitolerans]|uniref:Arginine biosynthesis bifunctional protein ArgJ n=1 Tax=Pelagirhabdus alkalitolerans TaxID=1612202 RepID=A0A1G6GKJ1_9BACI|nr:bifunctional ornithine acetyltransferase/N-acetylglutamate synthase [Pelagirhabdus alkalitolerans]SDB82429.1 glutamate N-acetyltransferase [Pelagirhabdus alkalitolerans]